MTFPALSFFINLFNPSFDPSFKQIGHNRPCLSEQSCYGLGAGEIADGESDKFKRRVKESIHIRTNSPTMNRDELAYQLPPVWNQLISTPTRGGGGTSTE